MTTDEERQQEDRECFIEAIHQHALAAIHDLGSLAVMDHNVADPLQEVAKILACAVSLRELEEQIQGADEDEWSTVIRILRGAGWSQEELRAVATFLANVLESRKTASAERGGDSRVEFDTSDNAREAQA